MVSLQCLITASGSDLLTLHALLNKLLIGVCSLVRVDEASSEDVSNEIGKKVGFTFIHALVKTSAVELLTPLNVCKFVDNSTKKEPRQCIYLKLFMNPLYVTFSTFVMFVIVALWEIEKHDIGVASSGETLIPSSEKVGRIVVI